MNTTVGHFLSTQTTALREAGIASARLDIIILLEWLLHTDRANILAHPERELSHEQLTELQKKCRQRKEHAPIAYLTGGAHFYGRLFMVNEAVLVPRPESEAMITLLLSVDLPVTIRVADIGTGSGCLAISAALALPPGAIIDACDISPAALETAKENAKALDADIGFHETDLLDGCPMPQDVLLANLPYVPESHPINQGARHEPRLALFSGQDGLDDYRKLFVQINALAHKPSCIITESLLKQHAPLAEIAGQAGYEQKGQANGLAQLFVHTTGS